MSEPTIEEFMTKMPHTIGHQQSLAVAHRLMRENDIRHLPVLEMGKLVGILSQRDLHLLETLKGVDQDEVRVSEAMSQDVFAVGPRTTLRKVTKEMAEHKYGCVVVMDRGNVIGIFTTTDALRVLHQLWEALLPMAR